MPVRRPSSPACGAVVRPFLLILSLGLASCGPAPAGNDHAPAQSRAEANLATPPETALNDAGEGPAANEATPAPKAAAVSERRCGWLQNPTPGNWWLVDGDGEWLLGAQGGYQAPGMDEMPDMSEGEWTAVNGNYGYGCACMEVVTDPARRRVVKLISATPKPKAQCRSDRRLPVPD